MAQKFKKGDRVTWQVGSGEATGQVEKRIMEATTVEGKNVAASPEDPRYLVKNDRTGKITGHTAEALSLQEDDSSDTEAPEQQKIIDDFQAAVNMTAESLEKWLKTKESKSVGQKDDDGEAIGHKSGKKIVAILRKDRSEYTADDFSHMKKVISYVHRHQAQKPSGDIEDTPWRYSLMNWGNDPMKDEGNK